MNTNFTWIQFICVFHCCLLSYSSPQYPKFGSVSMGYPHW